MSSGAQGQADPELGVPTQTTERIISLKCRRLGPAHGKAAPGIVHWKNWNQHSELLLRKQVLLAPKNTKII